MMDRPDESGERLEPWMEAEVAQAMSPAEASIPLERMWLRVTQAPRLLDGNVASGAAAPRNAPAVASPRQRSWLAPSLIAAGVLLGVAIGRFARPDAAVSADTLAVRAAADSSAVAATPDVMRPDSTSTAATVPPSAPAVSKSVTPTLRPRASMTITPVVAEHLQQTVLVLAAVRDAEHVTDGDSVTRRELQRLLTTTRQLLDEPDTRSSRTHRLLQDLELVLAQLARARTAAPATRAAADEALRETNLLPRLRAAAEIRSGSEER